MNIHDIYPTRRESKFDANKELAALLHGKRISRARAAKLLGVDRQQLNNWLARTPRQSRQLASSSTPGHYSASKKNEEVGTTTRHFARPDN